MSSYSQPHLIDLLKRDALRTGSFTLASGRTSHYYIDGRKVSLAAEGAAQIGLGMLKALEKYPEVAAVGGLTMGADPIVGAILALASEKRPSLRGFLVRKAAKEHGTGKLVEGPLEPGMTVAIVDDVVTTGGSMLQAADAVEAMGGQVAVVLAVVDRLEGAREACAARGYPFEALVSLRELGVEPLR